MGLHVEVLLGLKQLTCNHQTTQVSNLVYLPAYKALIHKVLCGRCTVWVPSI